MDTKRGVRKESVIVKMINLRLSVQDGTKNWYKEGKLHRDNDQPAIIEANGTKYWCKDGVQYTPEVKVVEEKKSQDETSVEENKRLKEEVTRLKKMIIELVST